MIVNTNEMLNKARDNKYAVPHFNINNLEWTKYILEECELNMTPVIIGVSEGALTYMGGCNTVVAVVKALVKDLKIGIPVSIHLDHGSNVEVCKKCIDAGFSSVMIDASKYDLVTNIKMVKEVTDYAHLKNVSVEAEIGHVGGVEDNVSATLAYASLDEAIRLVQETKIDSLAPAVGSSHGVYKGIPVIDYDLIEKIKNSTGLPLVLHGGSGIPDDIIKKSIHSGISKLNINTDLQIVWSKAVRKFLDNNSEIYDPRKIIAAGAAAMKKEIKGKIELLDSLNKA